MKKISKFFTIERTTNIVILFSIFLFLLNYFKPNLMTSVTITSGGDTASHYYPAKYMKDYLLPNLKLMGWCPGWYAGFPIFQFYFTLPFLLIVLMSYIIPLEIAFKLVTVLGIFLLPITTFFSMKLMKFKFPTPIIAAILTLPFLFMEANSMWGGNIPSTLAGEFSYSISLSLTALFFGLLYKGLEENKFIISNSILFALISLTHIYTMLFAGFTSAFLLLDKKQKIKKNFIYLVKTYSLSFLLIAFWILPLLFYLPYTTSYADTWKPDIERVFPKIISVFFPLCLVAIYDYIKKGDKRLGFLFFSIVIGTILFLFAETMGVVNIRYVPFIQLFLLIIAGYGLSSLVKNLKAKWLFALIVLLIVTHFVRESISFIPTWIKWNYEGFEGKSLWNAFKSVNEIVSGTENSPRVVYEHSPDHNAAGTTRAYESLPLFSGRSTLEGLYMQSSISSPFVFYIQSEISKVNSCPFWKNWPCSGFNIEDGTEHLKLFNVQYFVARSNQVKNALRNNENYRRVEVIEPYEVYELMTNKNKYVIVPDYEPVLFETKDWKNVSYEWFRDVDKIDIPLVFTKDVSEEKFQSTITNGRLDELSRIPINQSCNIYEFVSNEQVNFETTCPGEPHIIRISYHPNWKVEGADKVYLVSPSFMLVFPENKEVKLYYGSGLIDNIGLILTLIGIVACVYYWFNFNKNKIKLYEKIRGKDKKIL